MSDLLTWWPSLIVLVGGALAVFITLRFSLRAGLMTGASVAALFIDQRARQQGAASQKQKEQVNADKRADVRERIHEDAIQASDDDLRRRARRWVRDDGDGTGG